MRGWSGLRKSSNGHLINRPVSFFLVMGDHGGQKPSRGEISAAQRPTRLCGTALPTPPAPSCLRPVRAKPREDGGTMDEIEKRTIGKVMWRVMPSWSRLVLGAPGSSPLRLWVLG